MEAEVIMSKKCNIMCDVHGRKRREWEITSDGRVWPCCYFANAWDLRNNPDVDVVPLLLEDEGWVVASTEDSDWNNLAVHPLDDIIEHSFFQETIFFPGWESDNPNGLCVKECGVFKDPVTGKQTTNARLD